MATQSDAGPATAEDALDAFEYQQPTKEQTERIMALRQSMKDLRDQLQNLIPPSRQLSLAITKLEECGMWSNKAIVFNGPRPEPHP